jgi:hypothetical protein
VPPRFSQKRAEAPEAKFDADHKLLAFIGALVFVLGSAFWFMLALRAFATAGLAPLAGIGAAAVGMTGAFCTLLAWGLRTKLERNITPTGWEVRRLMMAGALVGIALGALPYLALSMRLKDPDLYHAAAEPEHLPPSAR